VKSSPTPGTSNSYVAFTLSLSKLCVYSRWLTSSSAKTLFSARSLVMPDPSRSRGSGLTRGLLRPYLLETLCTQPFPMIEVR
jgi:hypothetical protein